MRFPKLRKNEWSIIVGIILLLSSLAYAIGAYEAITVSSTPVQLTNRADTRFQYVFITVETNGVYFTLDGISTPTSAGVGHLLESGQNLTLTDSGHILNFKAVRKSATDAALKVTYKGN